MGSEEQYERICGRLERDKDRLLDEITALTQRAEAAEADLQDFKEACDAVPIILQAYAVVVEATGNTGVANHLRYEAKAIKGFLVESKPSCSKNEPPCSGCEYCNEMLAKREGE